MGNAIANEGPTGDDPQLFSWVDDLVARQSRYTSCDLAETQQHLHGLHESLNLKVADAADFVNYHEVHLPIGNLLVTMGCINARRGYELSFTSEDEYLITIPLRGEGWVSNGEMFVEYGQGDVMIVAPCCSVVKHWEGPGQVLSLHLTAQAFDAALGVNRRHALHDAPIFRIGARRLRSFLRMVDMICAELRDAPGASPFLRQPLSDRLEDMLLALLLEEVAGPVGVQPREATSPAIPYYVSRAEKFVRANAHRDISIEQMAAAAGVSLRTVQYGFRRYRETTPMLYLKRVRYERARAMLLSPTTLRPKISAVAAEIGCANISQFSRDYRSMFGETPSQTLASPRRIAA